MPTSASVAAVAEANCWLWFLEAKRRDWELPCGISRGSIRAAHAQHILISSSAHALLNTSYGQVCTYGPDQWFLHMYDTLPSLTCCAAVVHTYAPRLGVQPARRLGRAWVVLCMCVCVCVLPRPFRMCVDVPGRRWYPRVLWNGGQTWFNHTCPVTMPMIAIAVFVGCIGGDCL